MKEWLKDAVFYEIYPQSFYDTNGDGIGDLSGIIAKLDYIKDLGCNAIWMNPCYDSPFVDAGYDVRDYKKVAPRYGTEDDLIRLFDEVHKRDMHLILDLVPGHTSEEHEWFQESKKASHNTYSHRYIWTDWWLKGGNGLNFVAGEAERDGAYILNFFKCQPALNYGFLNPTESWQKGMDDPDCIATRDAIVDVMRYWLSKGCDGFRVDMADSLVKNDDEEKRGTVKVWQDMLGRIRKEFPQAVFVSEWGRPAESIPAGFDMDFYLDWMGNGYNSLLRDYSTHFKTPGEKLTNTSEDHSYFRKDHGGSIDHFLEEYMPRYELSKGKGYIALITGNHDTTRISYNLSEEELKLAYAFLFTMPGTPFLYYGDEIGMQFLDVPTKEGGYTRTGSRTPMQWDDSKNKGFSTADSRMLYLPLDEGGNAPTVSSQEKNDDSLLNTVKRLLKLRHCEKDLQDNANLEILSKQPLVYKRGSLYIALNPNSVKERYTLPGNCNYDIVLSLGNAVISDNTISFQDSGFCVVRTALS